MIVCVSHSIAFSCEYKKTTFLRIFCYGVSAMKLASVMCMEGVFALPRSGA